MRQVKFNKWQRLFLFLSVFGFCLFAFHFSGQISLLLDKYSQYSPYSLNYFACLPYFLFLEKKSTSDYRAVIKHTGLLESHEFLKAKYVVYKTIFQFCFFVNSCQSMATLKTFKTWFIHLIFFELSLQRMWSFVKSHKTGLKDSKICLKRFFCNLDPWIFFLRQTLWWWYIYFRFIDIN